MESMVTEPETIKRDIDISNIRDGEENVYGSLIPGPWLEAAWSVNEEIAGASSDNVDCILTSGCAKIRKARMPESCFDRSVVILFTTGHRFRFSFLLSF